MQNVNKDNPTDSFDSASLAMIRLIMGFLVSRAIYIAAQLGIADLLKDESKEIGELAKATRTHGPSL
jgi:hypothetical protein